MSDNRQLIANSQSPKMHTYGIVLHSLRYNDTRMIVEIFTAAAGTVSFIVPATRQRRSGMRAVAWQPLSLVEVIWEPRQHASLQKPQTLALWRPWRTLHSDPQKTAIGLYLSDMLYHALHHEQDNQPLFEFIVNALTWFDESNQHYVNFHIIFLLHLTRFLGFLPNVEDWHEGDYFDLQAAIFSRTRPYHIYYLEPEEAALVPKFLRMDLRSMRAVGLNRAIRRRTLEIICDFYRLHIPEFPETHSLSVLAEVFD